MFWFCLSIRISTRIKELSSWSADPVLFLRVSRQKYPAVLAHFFADFLCFGVTSSFEIKSWSTGSEYLFFKRTFDKKGLKDFFFFSLIWFQRFRAIWYFFSSWMWPVLWFFLILLQLMNWNSVKR